MINWYYKKRECTIGTWYQNWDGIPHQHDLTEMGCYLRARDPKKIDANGWPIIPTYVKDKNQCRNADDTSRWLGMETVGKVSGI